MVKLIIEDDEGKTTVVPLIRDEITIGRKEGNTIRLTERNVSRRHARLVKQNGGAIFIEDLNSYNGIKVNGNRIAGRVAVAEGDRIQIGDYVLGLKLEGVMDAAAAAAAHATETKTVELPRPPDTGTTQIEVAEPGAATATAAAPAAAVATKPAEETVARLVCVSTNFPGQEFVLDKSLMVIGRTEDNDIVVNHRSISRHHARIVEENGRFTIIDLQSSNGVRVNGEEYGKVELRRGDLIDLGHVRLRFVAAGEDFVFSRDASVVDISKPGRGNSLLWIAITLVVLLVAGGLVWKFALPGGLSQSADSGSGTAEGSGTGATGTEDQAQLATDLKNAITAEDWVAAQTACDKLTDRTAHQADCQKVAREKTAKEEFDRAYAAATENRGLDAVRSWNKIPEDSIYKNREPDKIKDAREKGLTRARTDLAEAMAEPDCPKAKELAATIKELDPSDTEAEQTAGGCTTVAAVGPDNKKAIPKKPRPKVPPKKPDTKVVVVPQPGPNQQAQVDQLVQQAQAAYTNGNHASSSRLAKAALKLQPSHGMAIQILGASACYLKNEREAKSAYDKLSTGPRNLLRSVCRQVGINLQ